MDTHQQSVVYHQAAVGTTLELEVPTPTTPSPPYPPTTTQ